MMKMDWRVDVIDDKKTTATTILFTCSLGGVSFSTNLLPRDAAEIARVMGEAARIATTGVIRPDAGEVKRILQ